MGYKTRRPAELRAAEGRVVQPERGQLKPHQTAKANAPIELPAWLTDQYALDEWHRLLPHLEPLGLLTIADAEVFGQYCQCVSDMRRCREEWERDGGATVVGGSGGLKNHPAWLRWRGLSTELRQWVSRLGLSPADRAGLKADHGDATDPLIEILKEAS